jgi:hypothetical protein
VISARIRARPCAASIRIASPTREKMIEVVVSTFGTDLNPEND